VDKNPPTNVFKEVHQKAQDAKEKLRRAREKLTGIRLYDLDHIEKDKHKLY
jgi:hypothetical protein